MAISVKSLIDNILSVANESGDNGLTRGEVLTKLNKARRKLNRFVPVVKGESRIQAKDGIYLYDKPTDFKSNLKRVEFNFKALTKKNIGFLDDYDESWRDNANRKPPHSTPQYFIEDTENTGKFIVYPPPPSDGEQGDQTGPGVLEDFGGTNLDGPGVEEDIVIEGERIPQDSPGVLEFITPQRNNLKVYYDKFLVDFETEDDQNIDVDFEPQTDSLEFYALYLIYRSQPFKDIELASDNLNLYLSEIKDIRKERRQSKPGLSLTILRQPGAMWGRRRQGARV